LNHAGLLPRPARSSQPAYRDAPRCAHDAVRYKADQAFSVSSTVPRITTFSFKHKETEEDCFEATRLAGLPDR
jgi:hypothetical protein